MPLPLAHPPAHDHPAAPRTRQHSAGHNGTVSVLTIAAHTWPAARRDGNRLQFDSRVELPRTLCLWHLASLDAPTVALVWCLAFAWTARVQLPLWIPVLLPLAVWAAYITDRLLDARIGLRTSNLELLCERHLFHWRHRRVFVPLAIAAALVAAWIIFALMPTGARERNALLAVAALVYFTRVHTGRKAFPLLSKEFLVGVLFTLGCFLPAWSHANFAHDTLAWPLLVPVAFFALLAWLNCYAIDRWEARIESATQHTAFMLSAFAAFAAVVSSAMLFASQPRSAALLASGAAASLLLALLDRLRKRFTPVTLRAAADLVLLTPAILLSLAPLIGK